MSLAWLRRLATLPIRLYQRYLDVDRHWPIAVNGRGSRGRTLEIRLPLSEQLWLEELAAATDRGLSAVIAVCLEAVRSEFGVPRAYTSVEELLADEELDAVSVCLPNFLHAQVVIDCCCSSSRFPRSSSRF